MNSWTEFILLINLKAALVISVGYAVFFFFSISLKSKTSVIDENTILKVTLFSSLVLPLISWLSSRWPVTSELNSFIVLPTETSGSIQIVSNYISESNYLFWSYLLISSILLLVFLVKWVVLNTRINNIPCTASGKDYQLVDKLKSDLGLSCFIDIKINGNLTPFVWGMLKPTIVVPNNFRGWDFSLRKTVFIHELIHIKHKDQLTILLSYLCCFIFFLNPLAWLLKHHLSKLIEKSCDAEVVNNGISAQEYSQNLLTAVKSLSPITLAKGIICPMANSCDISDRIKTITQKTKWRNKMSNRKLKIWLSGLVAIFTFIAFLQVSYAQNRDLDNEIMQLRISDSVAPPQYPTKAAQYGKEGWVIIEFDINSNGEVENPKVVDRGVNSEPQGIFDDASINSLTQWKYKTDQGLLPLEGVRTKFVFALSKESADELNIEADSR